VRSALSRDQLQRIYDSIAKRYDVQHRFITAGADGRGRAMVVAESVRPGDTVLDCGSGTGSTAFLALDKAGENGRVTLFDQSDGMLAMAREKAEARGVEDRVTFMTGNILDLPFESSSFDVVLSTYSMCPLFDPSKGALEMYRVVKQGGRLGAAHSAEPPNPIVRRIAEVIESITWRIPSLSMGCRAVSVLPALEEAGAGVLVHRMIGVPLWPFEVFVVEKGEGRVEGSNGR